MHMLSHAGLDGNSVITLPMCAIVGFCSPNDWAQWLATIQLPLLQGSSSVRVLPTVFTALVPASVQREAFLTQVLTMLTQLLAGRALHTEGGDEAASMRHLQYSGQCDCAPIVNGPTDLTVTLTGADVNLGLSRANVLFAGPQSPATCGTDSANDVTQVPMGSLVIKVSRNYDPGVDSMDYRQAEPGALRGFFDQSYGELYVVGSQTLTTYLDALPQLYYAPITRPTTGDRGLTATFYTPTSCTTVPFVMTVRMPGSSPAPSALAEATRSALPVVSGSPTPVRDQNNEVSPLPSAGGNGARSASTSMGGAVGLALALTVMRVLYNADW